ncbi:DUF6318 family protein [Rothia sp. P4278]|uniref:DUF6318 family protein n=1 Tax=Rothia sp. P4278 TaxID=3402658 RepID=UPI003ADBB4A6
MNSQAQPRAESAPSAVVGSASVTLGNAPSPENGYQPADERGPAQNVPKPVRPEGMNEETAEGLEKFILYWNDCVNYGIQTGDFSYAEPLVSQDYTADLELYVWAEEVYARGGWVVGGRREVVLNKDALAEQGNGVYRWIGNLNVEDMQAYLNEPGTIVDGSQTRGRSVYFQATYKDEKWVMDIVAFAEAFPS